MNKKRQTFSNSTPFLSYLIIKSFWLRYNTVLSRANMNPPKDEDRDWLSTNFFHLRPFELIFTLLLNNILSETMKICGLIPAINTMAFIVLMSGLLKLKSVESPLDWRPHGIDSDSEILINLLFLKRKTLYLSKKKINTKPLKELHFESFVSHFNFRPNPALNKGIPLKTYLNFILTQFFLMIGNKIIEKWIEIQSLNYQTIPGNTCSTSELCPIW